MAFPLTIVAQDKVTNIVQYLHVWKNNVKKPMLMLAKCILCYVELK